MHTGQPVLVVGAGPTGLMLALWLARKNVPVRIIDKRAKAGETSRAIVVHARTLELYRQLGFADEAVRRGVRVEQVAIRDDAKLEGVVPFGAIGEGLSPYPFILTFPQEQHEQLLTEQLSAAGVDVERSAELVSFEQTDDGVRAVLQRGDTSETLDAAHLAGCDGGHSRVRELTGIEAQGGTYEQRFYVADVEASGDAATTGQQMSVCFTGSEFAIVLPLRRSGVMRVIGVVPSALSDAEPTFDDLAQAVQRTSGLQVTKVDWFSTYQVHHRVAATFRQGRVFLLGDAAHVHSPVGGQGMNTGIGDAANLGWKLAEVLLGRAKPTLLDSFEPERMPFARRLVATTDRMFSLVTDDGALGRTFRSFLLPKVLPLTFKLKSVQRTMFRTNSQTRIEYRSCALNEGHAGAVRGGDRLPWAKWEGGDNYAPLRALEWQLHLYDGEPTTEVRSVAARFGVPVKVLPWNAAVERAGLMRGATYLVRPDGYVGFASSDGTGIATYLQRVFTDRR